MEGKHKRFGGNNLNRSLMNRLFLRIINQIKNNTSEYTIV